MPLEPRRGGREGGPSGGGGGPRRSDAAEDEPAGSEGRSSGVQRVPVSPGDTRTGSGLRRVDK